MIDFQPDETAGYIYRQVADHLAARIESGALPPGAPLPGENHLPEEYGVSRHTARHAVRLLRACGLVVTRPSEGSFVAQRRSNTTSEDTASTRKARIMPRPTDKDYQQQHERTQALQELLRDTLDEIDDCVRHADEVVRYDMTGLHEFERNDERDFLQHLADAGRHLRAGKRVLSGYEKDLDTVMKHEGIGRPEESRKQTPESPE